MNTPGKSGGNWAWRVQKEQLTEQLAEKIAAMTKLYGRANPKYLKKLTAEEAAAAAEKTTAVGNGAAETDAADPLEE